MSTALKLSDEPLILQLQSSGSLEEVERLDRQMLDRFSEKLIVNATLTRPLVSFQANKSRAAYRWYKFKEGFSAALVEHLLRHYGITTGTVIDPFAGSGTALFAASALGLDADGIELLPIGQEIIAARLCLEQEFTNEDFSRLEEWLRERPWEHSPVRGKLPVLRITSGAYPSETAECIERYLGAMNGENERVQTVLRLALLCILESVSYTRKDGQYLRWDYRSDRRQGARPFHKGHIPGFTEAMCAKIREMLGDLQVSGRNTSLFPKDHLDGHVRLIRGSCLEHLISLSSHRYDALITSPPYCNRYDYTRTYALELAILGIDEEAISKLRQEMLTCTVENRAKDLLQLNPGWAEVLSVAEQEPLLQAILRYLETEKTYGRLNNNGIPRMVRGYFTEMACVISECSRVLKSGARLFMVNDNVRYAGAAVSVDLILSHLAERLGFETESIMVLPNGKGNSSQQMGRHGREPLRKCVYVWRKI